MAKKLTQTAEPTATTGVAATNRAQGPPCDSSSVTEYGLIDDVVFDPPLMPEERRQRGIGIPIEERIEQARRQIADGSAWD